MPHRHRILLVDDDPGIVAALSSMIADTGWGVVACFGGADGFDELEHEETPCVILLDLMMPQMSGWEFREKQLRHPVLSAVPVIGISALPPEHWHPFDAPILSKPLDWDRLEERFRTLPCHE